MKKYYINERVFAIGDKYDIYDQSGNVAFFAKRTLFTFGNQYKVYNSSNQIVANINQKLFHLFANYEIIIDNKMMATVRKRLSFLTSNYDIISDFGEFTIAGDIFNWDFDINRNEFTVAKITKKLSLIKDRYEINIFDDIDEVFAISLVIILDTIHHEGKH